MKENEDLREVELEDLLGREPVLPDETLLLPGHNYGHVPNATMGVTSL